MAKKPPRARPSPSSRGRPAAEPGAGADQDRERQRRAADRARRCSPSRWANSPLAASYFALLELELGARLRRLGPREAADPLGQRSADGDVLLPRRARDQARGPGRRARRLAPRGAAGRGRARRHGRAGADLRRLQPRPAGGCAAGACRWRPTSRSRSACSRCSATASALALKVFLLALAIVDDLGAVLVIALFYTDELNVGALLLSFAGLGRRSAYGRSGGARPLAFALLGAGDVVLHAEVRRARHHRGRAAWRSRCRCGTG